MAAENFKVKKGLEVGTGATINSDGINVTGIITATTFKGAFSGDGSAITGVTASGTGILIKHDGTNVGTAGTINFSTNLDVSAISAGIVTVTSLDTGLSSVAADTTPQLGGNLDLDGKFITGSGGASITGVVTATTFVGNGDFVNLDVDGETDLDDLSVAGVSTFHDIKVSSNQHIVFNNGTWSGNIAAKLQHHNNIFYSQGGTGGWAFLASGGAGRLIIDGDGHVKPGTDSTYHLGASDKRWKNIYADDLNVAGVSTFTENIDANGNLDVDGQTDLDDVVISGVSTFNDGITLGTNSTTFAAKFADDAVANFGTDNDLQISHDNSNALIRNSTGKVVVVGVVSATSGANITGVVTATTFSGSGASLTNLPSGQLSGALPALDGSALTGVTASGTGIIIKHDGTTVGTAGTINFSTNLDVSAVSAGIVTITASGGGSGITTENVVADSLVVTGISTLGFTTITDNFFVSGVTTLSDSLRVGGHAVLTGTPHNYNYGRGGQDGGLSVYAREAAIEVVGDDDGSHGGSILIRTPTEGFGFVLNPGDNALELKAFTSTGDNFTLHSTGNNVSSNDTQLRIVKDGAVELYNNGTKKFETTQSGTVVTGICTATTFSGSLDASNLTGEIANGRFPDTLPAVSGTNLTNLNADNISSGTLATARIEDDAVTFDKLENVANNRILGRVSSNAGNAEELTAAQVRTLLNVADGANAGITTAASNFQVVYEILSSSSSGNGYRFSGPGNDGNDANPDLYLIRGQKYRFIHNASSSHPFEIRSSAGGSAYNDGVTNNGQHSVNIDFNVQHDAPTRLYYQCTNHGGMIGNIYITGGASWQTTDVNTSTTEEIFTLLNVGIGSANPTEKLDVSGTVKATSLQSTVSTGTAPFTVASTTVVTNLNADLVDGRDTSSSGGNNKVMITDASGNTSLGSGTLTGNVTGDLTGEVNSAKFDTNPSGIIITGVATATSFVGDLTGDVTGNATSADTIDVTAASNSANYFVTFVDQAGAGRSLRGDSGIIYNPSSNDLSISGAFTAGSLDISGDIDVDGHTELDDLNVAGVSTFSGNIHIGSYSNISSGIHGPFTASAGTAVEVDTTAIGSANAIEYTIFVSNSSNIQSQKVLIMDNGTTAYIQEFAAMSNPNLIATFSADVNSGNVRLLATPETGINGSTTIKFTKMIIE